MRVHLALSGAWQDCLIKQCSLQYHLPGTLAEFNEGANLLAFELIKAELEEGSAPDIYGRQTWSDENQEIHRDYDLPAAIYNLTGDYFWYQHGLLHRDHDRPARVLSNGTQEWWQHDKLHRDNGPAVIHGAEFSGIEDYYNKGRFLYRRVDGKIAPSNQIEEDGML
jgi:hypothetical protein